MTYRSRTQKPLQQEDTMIIRSIRTGELDNFTYIIGCEKTRAALVIDPCEEVDLISDLAESESLDIRLIFNTHEHGDHTGGNTELAGRTGAEIIRHKLAIGDDDKVDIGVEDKDSIHVGEIDFKVIHTPGHTPGCACLYAVGQLFTGDTLFVGDSGRTDLAGGHRPTLGASIREKLMILPDETVVWPGHDLGPTRCSTLGWEKRNNCNAKEYGYFVGDDT